MIDLIGQKFGRLIVLEQAGKDKWRNSRWLCQCDCKQSKIVSGNNLKSGATKSCGCLHKEMMTKHGCYGDKFYTVWQHMKQRCINPRNKDYPDYGGRGITVCDRWLNSFENFNEDEGENWKLGLTIERIDNKLGYYPGNCAWITIAEQQRNKRNNLYVLYMGKSQLFVKLCEEHNMPRNVVYKRYYILDWTLREALKTPVGEKRKWT
jgi:hypothetical protein